MPVYEYEKTITVDPNKDVTLEIQFPDPGTSAYNDICVSGGDSQSYPAPCSATLGKGSTLQGAAPTEVFSKAANLDADNPKVNINFVVNGRVELTHSNLKSEDESPQIVVVLTFD